jgi:flap endonuclease-1
MGIKNLNSLIEAHSPNGVKTCPLSNFQGMRMAIDANVYLYKYMYGKSTPIDGIFFMVNKFKKFGITPIFVFDGKPPSEKDVTILQRRQLKSKIESKIQEIQKAIEVDSNDELLHQLQQQERRLIYISDTIIQLVKDMFDIMGIGYIDSNMEAEHLCAKLCREGYVDAVVSEDMDAIACGSIIVLRDFSNRRDDIRAYYLERILDEMSLTYKMFADMCILLGNDYTPRARGYTPEMIYNDIVEHGSIETIKQVRTFRLPDEYQFHRLRTLLNLDYIVIDKGEISNQMKKTMNIPELREFMRTYSSIDDYTVIHRMEKMRSSVNKRPVFMRQCTVQGYM